jgi:hypothetical protein
MKRREFITVSTTTLGGLLAYRLTGEPVLIGARESEIRVPLKFFTAGEARIIAAACERIFPTDESGPGAKEAGTVIYIDRQLAGPYGRDLYRYTRGPFVESIPEHGYQGKANPQEIYREGMFSDPMHGGNTNLIGWQLIGYPGPLMSYHDEISKSYGEAFRRPPVSLGQVLGRSVKGWEQESQ